MSATGSLSSRWKAGTARPTGTPPSSCGGGGVASAKAAPSSSGAARPSQCAQRGAPTLTSSSSTPRRSPHWPTYAKSSSAAHTESFETAGDLVVGLQLTHSGRWSRPDGTPRPRTAHVDAELDRRVSAGRDDVVSDDELDELVHDFVTAAVRASDAGFDFVDVKHCHGYLLHELLSATDRAGRYGGPFEQRTQFLRAVTAGIRNVAPELAIGVRLSAYDFAPFAANANGVGVPVAGAGEPRFAFGGDRSGLGVDLTEAHRFLSLCEELGIGMVCITAGSPYYNPHVQRPAYFPPTDGYAPPADPLVDAARMLDATTQLAVRHPGLTIVGSGYSYLQQWLPNVAQYMVRNGHVTSIGIGRGMLSYPRMPADVLAGRDLQRALICRTFSDCTTAPRNGLVSGCYPLDVEYRDRPERIELAAIKRAAGSRVRRSSTPSAVEESP